KKRAGCKKRGGGADHLPLDWATADEKYQSQMMAAETPERAYDRAWAVTLLERVRAQQGEEMQADEKRELFEEVNPVLACDRDVFCYRDAANPLKQSVSPLRQRPN